MKKFNFSGNYKSKNSLLQTIEFINNFKNTFLDLLKKEFNLVYLESPKILKHKEFSNLRLINFDNKENDSIYQLISYPCKYLNKTWKKLQNLDSKINGVVTSYYRYERDSVINASNFIVKNFIDFRIRIPKDEKSNFSEIVKSFYKQINTLLNETLEWLKNNDKSLVINDHFLKCDYDIENIDKFFKFYQLLKINDYLTQKAIENKMVAFLETPSVQTPLIYKLSKLDDEKNNVQFLYFHEASEQVLNIIQMSLSSSELKDFKYVHISIDYDKLMMVLLDKEHLAEVVPGSWDDSVKKEAFKKKIDIL